MPGHAGDESFVMLDTRTLKAISLPVELMGSTVTVTAHGTGDLTGPPFASRDASGEAMRPLSPSQLRAWIAPDGSLAVHWVQRSRLAWSWLDEVGSPPDPSVQGYRLRLAGASAILERDCGEQQATFTAAEVGSLGVGPIELQLRQIGAMALSRPEIITINP